MKSFAWLLPLSLGLAVGYGIAWLAGPSVSHADMSRGSRSATDTEATATDVVGTRLRAHDPVGLRDAMRAAGWSDKSVRSVVNALLYDQYDAGRLALELKYHVKRGSSWWADYWNSPEEHNGDYQMALHRLDQEMRKRLEALCGPDPDPDFSWLKRQYGNLSNEKLRRLYAIRRDYEELIFPVREGTWGIPTKAEKQQQALLQQEEQKDIAGLLTSEELAEWKRRGSWEGKEQIGLASRMNASGREWSCVEAYQDAMAKLPGSSQSDPFSPADPNDPEDIAIRHAESGLAAKLITQIGLDRYRDYLRAMRSDYQEFEFAVRRSGHTAAEAAAFYDRRYDYGVEAMRVVGDADLRTGQKRVDLEALADKAKAEAVALVGADLAEAMADNRLLDWVKALQTGESIEVIGPEGVRLYHNQLDTHAAKAP